MHLANTMAGQRMQWKWQFGWNWIKLVSNGFDGQSVKKRNNSVDMAS